MPVIARYDDLCGVCDHRRVDHDAQMGCEWGDWFPLAARCPCLVFWPGGPEC